MSAGQRIREHRGEILRVAALHGAGNVLLFGSVARGEDTPESDVDLLVDVTGDTTPWFPGKRSPDPADDFLLALFEPGKADHLVMGDKSGLLSRVKKAPGSYPRATSPR
jgi:predicted nucleotidyltransferase